MTTSALHEALQKAVSQITFHGHRVNDDYSMNKRREILKAVEDTVFIVTPPLTNSFEVSLPLLVKLGSLVVHVAWNGRKGKQVIARWEAWHGN